MKRRAFLQATGAGLAITSCGSISTFGQPAAQPSGARPRIDRDAAREFLSGPISSVRTPFQRDGRIDEQGVRSFIDHSLAGGNKTVLLTAGDSQYSCLSNQEIARMTKLAAEHTAGRALVVAADNDFATPQAIEFAQYAKSVGADVLMCKPPDWAESATAESFLEHYLAVAEHIPVMLVTNVFAKRGHDFALQVIGKAIEKSPSVVAIKDDICGEFGRKLSRFCQGTGVVPFAGGLKKNHLNVVPVDGGPCYMSSFQVGAPHVSREYWAAIREKNLSRAGEIVDQYEKPFFEHLTTYRGGWNAAWHGALELFGVAQRWRRKPYYSLTDQELEQLKQKLIELRLLRV